MQGLSIVTPKDCSRSIVFLQCMPSVHTCSTNAAPCMRNGAPAGHERTVSNARVTASIIHARTNVRMHKQHARTHVCTLSHVCKHTAFSPLGRTTCYHAVPHVSTPPQGSPRLRLASLLLNQFVTALGFLRWTCDNASRR